MPVIAGGLVVALALPVFLAAGWELAGWALGAALWAREPGRRLRSRAPGIGAPTLARLGRRRVRDAGRGIVLMVVLIVVASFDPDLALAGALVYAAAYTVELALSLTTYFSGSGEVGRHPLPAGDREPPARGLRGLPA